MGRVLCAVLLVVSHPLMTLAVDFPANRYTHQYPTGAEPLDPPTSVYPRRRLGEVGGEVEAIEQSLWPPPANVRAYGALADGSDDTAESQAAADAAASPRPAVVEWPAGTYVVCGLIARQLNQIWKGAGMGATTLISTNGCANLITTSSTGGPVESLTIEDMTLKSNNATNLLAISGRDVTRLTVRNVAFDLGTTSGDTQGLILSGVGGGVIEHNECYSSVPGHGKCFVLFRNVRNTEVIFNRVRYTYQGIELGSEGTEGVEIFGNDIMLGWAFLPIKYANSGGTVTYTSGPPDQTLNDSAANFQGLCNDTGSAPATCSAGLGNHVRIMSPIVNGSAPAYNNGGNIITDAGVNFVSAGVKEGDIVVSGKVCRGNGASAPTIRASCSGTSGTGTEGDRCTCVGNSDCASAVCEERFSWVVGVNDATHLAIDEWTGYTDRMPVGAPLDATYTVYSWQVCQVGSYTSTSITCSAVTQNTFKNYFGTSGTIADGTRYEVMTRHPNYPITEGALARHTRIESNTIRWGFSDNIFTTGFAPQVINNTVLNGWDHCYNIQGPYARIEGNLARHCGARGIADFSPYSIFTGNIGIDSPWTAVGASNCPIVMGLTSGLPLTAANNYAITDAAMTGTTSGHCVQNTSDGILVENATCQGLFTTSCIHTGAGTNVNTRIAGWHGETIAGSGTFSIEGGLATFAQMNAIAPLGGSWVGCGNCNGTCTAGSSNGKLCQRVTGTGWTN